MNAPTNFQTIVGADGAPAFVVLPYAEFLQYYERENGLVPNAVAGLVLKQGYTAVRAWREHLGLTQADVAGCLGITQAAFSQMENSERPRRATLLRIAAALNITVEQLDF